MPIEPSQAILFAILAAFLILLIWGRWRYDLVAFGALMAAVITGVIPTEKAFSGFGHPAVVIIALVLIVSRGLLNSGAVDLLTRFFANASRSVFAHISILSAIAAAMSAVMNNVAALALLMPVELQTAAKAKRSPAQTLMPLSFATILGGLVTLIGTPPNIIIAAYREDVLGQPFGMFDFAPVGLACAVIGILFVALIGWRLIPSARLKTDAAKELSELGAYVAEVIVGEGAKAIGMLVRDLDPVAEETGTTILGLVRRGRRLPGLARLVTIQEGDLLVIQAGPKEIDELVSALGLTYVGQEPSHGVLEGESLELIEVVVPEGARIQGRTALSLQLLHRHAVSLLGVSRQGRPFRDRVRRLTIEAGDVLLLLGPSERLEEITGWLGCLPLAERGLQLVKRDKAWTAALSFAAAVVLASTGLVYLPIALGIVAGLYVLTDLVTPRQLYDTIEWPVIVLLGSAIPLGVALQDQGGTKLIADAIVSLSAGYSPAVVLGILMVVTMTLSDAMNNTATAVMAAPIAVDIARALDVSPDPFLMAVAVAASCAFLTPIGHKNNTLIMGPGGYRFGDYWRMGLPLEILVIAVAIPVILIVWPF